MERAIEMALFVRCEERGPVGDKAPPGHRFNVPLWRALATAAESESGQLVSLALRWRKHRRPREPAGGCSGGRANGEQL